VYRAYRVPYEWVPQLERPKEKGIKPIDVTTFRVPGAAPLGPKQVTTVAGVRPYQGDAALCVQVDVPKLRWPNGPARPWTRVPSMIRNG
ncbi:MAG: hypothetical protein PHS17_12685, partial [Desulfobacterales bacterium]|nr:hypothetical protein [Desulfobacterales bacterium]